MKWSNTALFSDDDPSDAAFRAEVRAWMEANRPEGILHRGQNIPVPLMKQWHRKLYERGWAAPSWPKQYGGMGATLMQQIILFEELGRIGAPPPFLHGLAFIGPVLIQAGTLEQKARHLPGILSGAVTWCQGYSEPGAGSDLASLRTTAVLDGDHFVVNGQKVWTTRAHHADWMFALVRTDQHRIPPHAGISMLLIDMKSPGITVRPIKTIRGDAEFAEEFFDEVRVPRENLVGDLNEGWKLANLVLSGERFTTSHPRNAAVLLDRVWRLARMSGAAREPVFRQRLAALEIDLLTYTAYYRQCAKLHADGRSPQSMAAVSKIAVGELQQRASELAVLASGPVGMQKRDMDIGGLRHNPALDLMEMRRVSVGGGALEIQRNILAKRTLRLPS